MADGKLIVQILLDGADSVKAALEQLGVAGKQSVEGLASAVNQVSGDKLAEGIRTGATQSKLALEGLADSAKTALGSIQQSFGTIIPLAAIEAPFIAIKAQLTDMAATAGAAFAAIGAAIARLLEVPIDLAFALGLGGLIQGFGAAGQAAANFGRNLLDLGGGLLGAAAAVAVLAAAFTAAVFGLFEFARSSSAAVLEVSHLATLAGITVQQMSGLTAALAQMGVSSDNLLVAFRRLSVGIENAWENIQKKTRTAAADTIRNHLAVEEAALNLTQAEFALARAQGLENDPSALEALRVKQALLGVERARLAVSEALRKAQEDEANSIQGIIRRINELVSGVTVLRGGFQAAALTGEQLFEGIVAKASQAAAGFKIISGGIQQLGAVAPNARQVLLQLADVFERLADGPQKTQLAFKAFGRSVSPELIDALSRGRKAILEIEQEVSNAGLVFDEVSKQFASKFKQAMVQLGDDLSRTKTQLGALFEPAFIEGMNFLSEAIRANHDIILAWGRDIAERVKPVIVDFFKLLAGRQDIDTTWLVALRDLFIGLGSAISVAWGVIRPIIAAIHSAFGLLADAINSLFGSKLTAGDLEAIVILGLIAEKFGLISSAAALLTSALGPVGAAIAVVAAAFALINWDQLKKDWADSIEQWQGWIDTITKFDVGAFLNNMISQLADWAAKHIPLVQRVIDIWQRLKDLWASFTGPPTGASGALAGAGDGGGGGFAGGGLVSGSRGGFLAMLHGMEFVLQESAVRRLGLGVLNMLNAGFLPPGFASGGLVGSSVPALAGSGGARHVLNLTIDGKRFNDLNMSEDTARALSRFAVSRQMSATGRNPSWVK